MKKRIALLLISLLSTPLFAQQDSKISLGVKAGINAADQLQPDARGFTDFKMDIGWYVGATGYVGITDAFGIAGELVLSTLNSTLELDTSSFVLTDFDPVIREVIQEVDFKQTVLQLPVLFQYNLFGNQRVNFQAGPQLSYILNRDQGEFDVVDSEVWPEDEQLGVDISVGWNIGLTESIYLNGKYYFGITERDHLRPSVFQFGVGYQL